MKWMFPVNPELHRNFVPTFFSQASRRFNAISSQNIEQVYEKIELDGERTIKYFIG